MISLVGTHTKIAAGALLVSCAALLASPGPALAESPVLRVVQQEKAVLTIRTPTATQIDPPKDGFVILAVDPQRGGEAMLRLRWPGTSESRLRLFGLEKLDSRGKKFVELSAELELPGGAKTTTKRQIRPGLDSTALFEVYRHGQRALILTIESEMVEETVVPGIRAAPGRDVLFLVEVQRVLEGRAISLERNQLHTFVGESVAYSFKLGEALEADAVRIEFKPLRITGDLIEIQLSISGTLPGKDGPQVSSRGEEWLASRGAASTLALETGDPPTGYRFVVTAMF